MVAFVSLLRVLAKNVVVAKTIKCEKFYHLATGETLTWFNGNKRAHFGVKKKYNEAFRDVYFRE